MINSLFKIALGKELILYEKHRQTIPLVNNPINRQKFIFIDVSIIWRSIPFKGSDKRKYKIMYVILSFIKPRYILTINWISPRESLYKVWTKSHPDSKFIVVQHGSYIGGVVTDIAHRYTKCDIFLTWSNYFTKIFREYNKGKSVEILTFGNPVYNLYNRSNIRLKINNSKNVLLIPSPVSKEILPHYNNLIRKLKELGYSVYFKPHSFQKRSKYAILTNVIEIRESLPVLLNENSFDFIISDKSTAMLDAIFFKNKVVYFNPSNCQEDSQINIYSTYLNNIYPEYLRFETQEDFNTLINIEAQEKILSSLHKANNNILNVIG